MTEFEIFNWCSDAMRTRETLKIMQGKVRGFSDAKVHFISSFYSIAAMDGQTAEHLQQAICKFSRDEILTVMWVLLTSSASHWCVILICVYLVHIFTPMLNKPSNLFVPGVRKEFTFFFITFLQVSIHVYGRHFYELMNDVFPHKKVNWMILI